MSDRSLSDEATDLIDWEKLGIEELESIASELRLLKAREGWSYYLNYLAALYQVEIQKLVAQATTQDGVYQQEFNKGKAAGILLARGMVDSLIELLESHLDTEKSRRGMEEDE